MIAAALLLAAAPAVAGCYRAAAGPDVASALELGTDGRFRYMLAAGALDEQAAGRWTFADGRLTLRTEPTPKSAVFVLKASAPAEVDRPAIRVVWPNGQGIAGVDLTVGLDDRRTLEGYTQEDGWSLPQGERHAVRWVELAVPMYELRSPRFTVAAGAVTFELTPNDLGTIDFAGVGFDVTADGLVMHRGPSSLTYRRTRC